MSPFKVVILSYNLPQHTERCVRSVLALVPGSCVILVHNGSSQKNVANLRHQFPDIEHLVLEANRHFSGGANAGLREAAKKSRWILFITNDCQLKSLTTPPVEPGIYAPHILQSKSLQTDSLGGAMDPENFRLRHLKSAEEFTKYNYTYIPGTAFWIDAESFSELTGFDESLQTYWEDVDLSLRAKNSGIPLGLRPSTEILHDIGKTCHADTYYTTYLYQRNRKRLILKFAPSKSRALAHWTHDNLRMIFQSLKRRDIQKARLSWKALWD